MNLFPNSAYNNAYMSPNSSKPIVGVVLNTAFKRPLKEVRLLQNMEIGKPVTLTNDNVLGLQTTPTQGPVNAQEGLAPTVLYAKATEKTPTTGTGKEAPAIDEKKHIISGFTCFCPNAVLQEGDVFPSYLTGQLIFVAMLNSGASMYLPCDNSVSNMTVNASIYWDFDSKVIKKLPTTGAAGIIPNLGNARIDGQVVDGILGYMDNGVMKVKDHAVVKILF